jgi:hypothetical protein
MWNLEETPERVKTAYLFMSEYSGTKWTEASAKGLMMKLGVPQNLIDEIKHGEKMPEWYLSATWLREILRV